MVARTTLFAVGISLGSFSGCFVMWNRTKLGKLLDKLEKEPFLANSERGGLEEDKLIRRWFIFNYIQSTVFCAIVVITLSIGIGNVLFKRIKYNDRQLPYGPLTILNVTQSHNYEILLLYQSGVIIYCCLIVASTVLIFTGLLSFVTVQFKLLQNYLKSILYCSYKAMSKKSLKNAVLYHLNIIALTKEIEEIFNPLLTMQFACLLTLCFEVYQASVAPPSGVQQILLEIITILNMPLLFCYWGEQVTHESEQVRRAAYDADFIGTDLRFQKGLIIIMHNSQDGIQIKAAKVIPTSLLTFASVRCLPVYFNILLFLVYC
ncbi:hypothetical protein ILUMI_22157 [Ignelater luminosus]|uniref:Odorant receptor n=1 Tax=Ignelater luminosus TaxID=2038154 RepID=A0A8K0G332_IGNLU|nr:hypothetical protein ILUMI_22157 [Ignelater luminosus]